MTILHQNQRDLRHVAMRLVLTIAFLLSSLFGTAHAQKKVIHMEFDVVLFPKEAVSKIDVSAKEVDRSQAQLGDVEERFGRADAKSWWHPQGPNQTGFTTGFPDFHEGSRSGEWVFGMIRIRNEWVTRAKVPVQDLRNPSNAMSRLSKSQEWAVNNGYAAAIPSFNHFEEGGKILYDLACIRKDAPKPVKVIRLSTRDLPDGWHQSPDEKSDLPSIFRRVAVWLAQSEYAGEYGAAYPTFYMAPVSLFDTTFTSIESFSWKTTAAKDGDHGQNVTHTLPTPIIINLERRGDPEEGRFGTEIRLLDIGNAPSLQNNRLVLEDTKAVSNTSGTLEEQYRAQQKVLFSFRNSTIEERNGELILLLRDLTTFQNEAYTKKDDFVGPFLESVKVSYGQVPGWGLPQISPLSQNKDGSYNQSTTMSADLTGGFSGKVPSGSLSAGISQTSGSSTSLSDIAFSQTTSNSSPIFTWKMANYYEKPSKVQSYEDNPFRMVRKEAAQIVASGNSTYHAPDLSQGSFQIATHNAYTVSPASIQDFNVKINYEVAYRVIMTKNRKHKNDLLAFDKGVAFVFGLNPDMWSAETFKTWQTAKRTFKFSVIVKIPKSEIVKVQKSEIESQTR